MNKVPYTKMPLPLSLQVALLRSRGMEIRDGGLAEDTLLRTNYYRFSGYALHFEEFANKERTHRFKPGTTFEAVIRLYEFDTQLRALLFRYIEPLEVAFRAAICNELSVRTHNPHWYLERTMYLSSYDFQGMEQECEREYCRSDEIFIKRYREKYCSPKLPPAWMMSEVLGLGRWSKLYAHLVDRDVQKAIAHHFATKTHYLKSWIHSLSVLRNLCAHHCRIWNRTFRISPQLPKQLKPLARDNRKLAAQVIVLTHLLKPLGRNSAFDGDWRALLDEFPDVSLPKMGFLEERK